MIIHASSYSYSPPEYNIIKDLNVNIPLVLVTRVDNFIFNEELNNLDKYILCNLSEFGWSFPFNDTPIFGKNIHEYSDLFPGDEWKRFNDFIDRKKPLLTFQRELLKKDVTDTILPIDYPFYGNIPSIQTKDEYYARPINVFHYWGRSSEVRVKTHADVWLASSKNGASVCDNIYYLQKFITEENNPNKWVSLHIPHFSRHNLEDVLFFNGLSKLSLSLPGCGKKCFRSAEASSNSIMITECNDLSWQFPWHVDNCLLYYDNDPIKWAEIALNNTDDHYLYNTYCAGIENAMNYQIDNYTRHLEQLINKSL